MDINLITEQIIGAAIDVHRALGPGLLESAYERCLLLELAQRGLSVERQKSLPLTYRGMRISCGYRLDLLVNKQVIVEVKSAERLDFVFICQLLTYMKLTGCQLGLIINFNVPLLKNGIKRVVNGLSEIPPGP